MKRFEEVVQFHGHVCPGLTFGFRVALRALDFFGNRARDEELVAIVENRSCAVDAIQVVTGCTFGKGNLLLRDYGKQVYTFLQRSNGAGLRVSVVWNPPPEDEETAACWRQFSRGDRSPEIMRKIRSHKGKKVQAILQADAAELFVVREVREKVPPPAMVYPSMRCAQCGEKVMEPKTVKVQGVFLCPPCAALEVIPAV